MKYFLTLIAIANCLFTFSQSVTFLYDASGNRINKQISGNLPTAGIGIPQAVCEGDIAQLTATGGITYLWDDGYLQSTINIPADTSQWFWVIAYNGQGCGDTAYAYLNVVPVPITSQIIGDTLVNAGDTITYTVENHSGSFYDWSVSNGTIIAGYGTNQIQVVWDSEMTGTISVFETINNGQCSTNQVSENVDIVTSVVENNASEIKVYPNPTDGNSSVEFYSNTSAKTTLVLINSIGQVVYSQIVQTTSGNNKFLLDNTMFGIPGMYILIISTDKEIKSTKISIIH